MITCPELSHEHEVLLRATLGQGQVVIDAWNEWQRRFDLATIDSKGYVLLPQLYLRLRQLDVPEATLAKLRGIYRHTWCKNQVFMTRLASALSLLQERGIGCLLLGGAAVMATSRFGFLPLEKGELLVPGARFADATAVFRQEGWSQRSDWEEEGARLAHSINFTHSDGTTCTIYRSVFAESTPSWADEDCWRHASACTVQDVPVRVLSATDHVLKLLVDVGMGCRPFTPRWVADVGTLLTAAEGSMSWERLRVKCATLRLTLPVKRSLAMLQMVSVFGYPRELRDLAATMATTWAERRGDERRLRDPAQRRGATGALAAHWCRYKRVVGEAGHIPGFVKYLQEMWEVPSVWLLPVAAIGKWRQQLVGMRQGGHSNGG